MLVTSDLFATRIISYSRDKAGCGLTGCGQVEKNKTRGSNSLGEVGWIIEIKCRGKGLSFCSLFAANTDDNDIDVYDGNIFNTMSSFIEGQISVGIQSGNVVKQFQDTSGLIATYRLTWSFTIDSNGEEYHKSTIELI